MLKRGSKGTKVKELQKLLSPRYYRGRIDGDFGPLTEAAVREWQQMYFVDGKMSDCDLEELSAWSVQVFAVDLVTRPKNRRKLEVE